MSNQVEGPLRKVKVKPTISGSGHTSFPTEGYFIQVIQKQNSIMHFIGQILSFWGYTEPTEIDVYAVNLNHFQYGEIKEGAEILEKVLSAIKILHFRNRADRKEQIKDIGRIIWLMEEYSQRMDRYCPQCSDQIPLRFADVWKFCGKCNAKLEIKQYTPPRFQKKNFSRVFT